MGSLRQNFGRSKNEDSKLEGIDDKIVIPIDLSNDPEYINLIKLFQNGDFSECSEALEKIEERYPEHPALIKFAENLQMKMMVKAMEEKSKKVEKRAKVKNSFSFILLIVAVILVVATVFYFSFRYFNNQIAESQRIQQSYTLDNMANQAESLLLVGNPQPAAAIIDKIREINPDYERLSTLTIEVELLLRMEAKYQEAESLVEAGNPEGALALFYEIQEESPGLWDISQQIEAIETENQIAILLADGNTAYENENWDIVISSYESALALNSQLDDPLITEQLLQGYLKKIISMLEDDGATIEDIEDAEQYYRKAVALIPQSKEYANERENLQEASSNLLQLKFIQTAKEMLADSNQTITSVKKAVTYLSKAVSIDPKNSALQIDLNNAEYYQVAFQDFLDIDWAPAITNLKKIMESDPNFAGGNSATLLYEAYSALGEQYYSAGFYSDALNNFEQAELVAWDDRENKMKLFQVQLYIGDTYGKLRDYENAVSYYLYALNSIEITSYELTSVNNLMAQATYWNATSEYDSAYSALQEVLQGIDSIYINTEIEISDGACLAFFANDNLSTIDAVLEANNLPKNMVINFGRQLIVPSIQQ